MALKATRPVPSNTGASRTIASSAVTSADLVHTATLIRGRVYVFKYKGESYHFEMDKPEVLPDAVKDALADELEALHAEIRDSDGDSFEKPLFLVERDVHRPIVDDPRASRAKNITRLPPRPLPKAAR